MPVDIDRLFDYHGPSAGQFARYADLTAAFKAAAKIIVQSTPESAEQTLAIRKLQEARMWANASIAINEGLM